MVLLMHLTIILYFKEGETNVKDAEDLVTKLENYKISTDDLVSIYIIYFYFLKY